MPCEGGAWPLGAAHSLVQIAVQVREIGAYALVEAAWTGKPAKLTRGTGAACMKAWQAPFCKRMCASQVGLSGSQISGNPLGGSEASCDWHTLSLKAGLLERGMALRCCAQCHTTGLLPTACPIAGLDRLGRHHTQAQRAIKRLAGSTAVQLPGQSQKSIIVLSRPSEYLSKHAGKSHGSPGGAVRLKRSLRRSSHSSSPSSYCTCVQHACCGPR